MKNKNEKRHLIDAEVSKTLQSLDNLEDIEDDPFFYARLQKRLDRSDTKGKSLFYRLSLGNRLAPAALGLIFVLNLISVIVFLQSEKQDSVERQTYIETIADEYSQSGSYLLSEIWE